MIVTFLPSRRARTTIPSTWEGRFLIESSDLYTSAWTAFVATIQSDSWPGPSEGRGGTSTASRSRIWGSLPVSRVAAGAGAGGGAAGEAGAASAGAGTVGVLAGSPGGRARGGLPAGRTRAEGLAQAP